jgi:hypothetical protein
VRIAVALAAVSALAVTAAGCGGSCDCGAGGAVAGASTTRTGSASGGERTIRIHVVRRGRQVIALVPVTISGKGPFTFALDTGASQSLVDRQVAAELDVKQTGATEKVAGVSSIGNGTAIAVEHWRVGGVTLPATTVIAANLPFGNASGGVQGLLGSDMLSGFDRVTIDYQRQVLRLHPRASG